MLNNESAGAENNSDSAGAEVGTDIDVQVNDDGSVEFFDAGAQEQAQQSVEDKPEEQSELDARTQGILDSGRTRIKNLPDADQLVVAYASAHNISLQEAQSQLGGYQPQAQADSVQDDQPSDAELAFENINTQIQDIDSKISELRAEGELEQADALLQKRFDLQEKRINTQMDIREAQQSATAEEQQAFTRSWDDAADKAVDLYPDLEDESSELFQQVQTKYNALKATNDPALHNPEWPFQAAAVVAAELGLSSKNAQPVEPANENPFANRRRPTNATPTRGSRSATGAPPMDTGAIDFSKMTADQGAELLKKIGRGMHD